MTTETTLSVFVHALPQRILSSNAGARSRRDPWAVAQARGTLKGDVMFAIMDAHSNPLTVLAGGGTDLPHFDRATATVTLRLTNKKPHATDCRQCVELIAGGEYPSWSMPAAGKPIPCCHYRPKDVGNMGGDVLKPILDAFTWLEIWPDDDWKHVPEVTLRIERVETIEEEGICVEVTAA